MRFRSSSASRAERAASFAAAVGVTVAAGLLVTLGPGKGILVAFGTRPQLEPAAERVVYVAPRVLQMTRRAIDRTRRAAATPAASRIHTRTPASSDVIQSSGLTDTAAAQAPRALPRPTPPTAPTSVPTSAPPIAAGAPAAAAAVGFTRPSEPIRLDSAVAAVNKRFTEGVASGFLKPPPPTQAEVDAKLRDEAFEALAARGGGVPVRRVMTGGSIPVPLPFGGPSRKQRERDRAVFAELQKAVAARQQRADSVAAARKRRADSLALSDSGRRENH